VSTAPVPIVGVSLGHRHEKTAISVTERAYVSTGETFNATHYEPGYGWPRLERRPARPFDSDTPAAIGWLSFIPAPSGFIGPGLRLLALRL
jgi:hypothetical protein